MNEQEKEINLKRLLYKAAKNWRKAALAAIAGAVIAGGIKCGTELSNISDPEVVAERQTRYLGELAQYQQEGDLILKDMDALKASLTQQNEYNENSVIMKIDPYNEWLGSVDFYVETDWKIIPELTYQNQNPANQIVRVYSTYITNGELYQYVNDRLDKPMENRYLREILGYTTDDTNYLIHFSVRGTSQEECQKLLAIIEEGMRAKQTEITASVGDFKLLTTNSSTYSQINYGLEQTQKNNLQSITDMNTALSAKQFELMEWEKDEEKIEEPVVDSLSAVKAGIKRAVLAGVILAFVVFAFYGVGYLLSKLVQDRDEFDSWGCFVGELPKKYKRKAFRWVDRLVGRWFLGNVCANEYDIRLAAAAKQISEAAKLSCDKAEPTLVLAGDLPAEELKALAEAMQKVKSVAGVRFVAVGNPLVDAEAIEGVLQADAVVLVAKQEYTKRETVYQIKAQLQELKKKMAAVVLTEVDAVM